MAPEIHDKLNRLREKALAAGVPAEDVERWLATARPCATLSPKADGPLVGRLGGPLMLPPGAPDPEQLGWLHLAATLDLAALPADATDLPLPADGTLVLLTNTDALDSIGEAIRIPPGTPVEEREVIREDADWFTAGLDALIHGELRLRRDVSFPGHDSIIDTEAHPHHKALREAWWSVESEDPHRGWSLLQIGGYAWDEYGEIDPVTQGEYGHDPEDPVLLAQWSPGVDNLEGAEICWSGDRGDLAAGRFDRVVTAMFFAP
ncbi:DUF1963 domain-containing protein [Streptomyces zhihengii]